MMTLNHHQPLIRFMGEAQRGVRGFVVDQAGRPLENVAMKIKGRDAPFQTTKHGEFWRILLPGYYRIEVIFLNSILFNHEMSRLYTIEFNRHIKRDTNQLKMISR